MPADIVIRDGLIADGRGGDLVRGDVAIRDGIVTDIGIGLSGRRAVDASDRIVAPGFIDIHTHFDAQVFWDRALTPSSFHGVTSVIAGNCGFTIAPTRPEHHDVIARTLENVEDMDVESLRAGVPWDFETFPEYLESVRRRGTVLNFGAYIGHTALRLYVMGDDAYSRSATVDEIDRMEALVVEAMSAGAVGFASSFGPTHLGLDGKPVPSRLAELAEFERLASAVGRHGAGVVGVVPGEPLTREALYDVQPRVGAPITYGALLTRPNGAHLGELELNRRGRAAGAEVWPQVTPRPIAFSISMRDPFLFNPNPVLGSLLSGTASDRLAAYADAGWRARAMTGFAEMTRLAPRWETYEIGESATRPDLIGRRVVEIADEWAVSPFDLLCQLAVADSLATRVTCVVANDDVDGVRTLLLDDGCTLGLSDAGAHVGQICDAVQSTEFLGTWVRDRELMPLGPAVRRLTGQQADLFGFADRGYLAPGMAADIVVFDADTIAPGPTRRVADFPAGAERLTADSPTGVHHVLVNGVPIRLDERQLPEEATGFPGRSLVPRPRAHNQGGPT